MPALPRAGAPCRWHVLCLFLEPGTATISAEANDDQRAGVRVADIEAQGGHRAGAGGGVRIDTVAGSRLVGRPFRGDLRPPEHMRAAMQVLQQAERVQGRCAVHALPHVPLEPVGAQAGVVADRSARELQRPPLVRSLPAALGATLSGCLLCRRSPPTRGLLRCRPLKTPLTP